MANKTRKIDDDKEFTIITISRGDVREVCGDEVADRLSDDDLKRLAEEMAESYCSGSFMSDLAEIIDYKFSE